MFQEPSSFLVAKLKNASPEFVFQELKQYSKDGIRSSLFRNKDLEDTLAERNIPLINLALARYGMCEDVIFSLFNKACNEKEISLDSQYCQAIRVAILSNEAIHFVNDKDDRHWDNLLEQYLTVAEYPEVCAFLKNPSIPKKFIVNLLSKRGHFFDLEIEEWLPMIVMVAENPIFSAGYEGDYSFNFGASDIQKAIIIFLENAPIERKYIVSIAHKLLSSLNPSDVAHVDDVSLLIDRWSVANSKTWSDEQEEDGDFTSSSKKIELLILIAALFGGAHKDKKLQLNDSAIYADLLSRCIEYGNSIMTPRKMKRAYSKDREFFILAALFNQFIHVDKNARKVLKSFINSDNSHLYKRNCEVFEKKDIVFNNYSTTAQGSKFLSEKIDSKSLHIELMEKSIAQSQFLIGEILKLKKGLNWLLFGMVIIFFLIVG